jgi:phage major head subunit gpT-like protein
MTIFRNDIAGRLGYGVRSGFLKGQKTYTPVRSAFVRETTSTGKDEDYSDVGTVPMPVAYDDMVQVRGTHEVTLTITNKDYEITIGISHNAINDDRVGNLDTWARQAGRNFEKHMDKLCFLALNAGDASTYGLCYDGQNLFSASHADSGAEYTTAQDNQYGLTLSLDNFETVRVAGQNFLDGRGEPVMMDYDLLIVPPALERIALNITGNPQAYDTANREENPYAGMMKRPLASTYLDATAWFLVASMEIVKPIILQIRQQPMLTMWDDERQGEGGVRYFKFHGRYNVGYGDWRTVLMGNT